MKVLRHNTKAVLISIEEKHDKRCIHHEMIIDYCEKGWKSDQIIYYDKKTGMSKCHAPKDGWHVVEVVEIK